MTLIVGATAWVASINRWASRKQCHSLRRAAVVLEGTKQWVVIVQITRSVELAGVIAAQVVTMRSDSDGAATIYACVVVDDAVLERRCSAINDAASRVSTNGAVIHCEGP